MAEFDRLPLHPALRVDDIDVVAALIGEHRRARDDERFDRLRALQQHVDELRVDELTVRATAAFAPGIGGLAMTARNSSVSVELVTLLLMKSSSPTGRKGGRPAA